MLDARISGSAEHQEFVCQHTRCTINRLARAEYTNMLPFIIAS